MNELLNWLAEHASEYQQSVKTRNVAPTREAVERLLEFDTPLADEPVEVAKVIHLLEEIGAPASVTSTGGRYFGYVIGGTLPAAHAANWLVDTWNQNSALRSMSPVSIALEEIAIRWLIDILGLPKDSGAALVTGATMASFTALAAARHAVLERADWNVEEHGLFGAPEISVVVGEEVHATIYKALAFLGLGSKRVKIVPADGQGRMRADLLPPLDERTIICLQAGNVNTGAFDPATEICQTAREAGAWIHVDGAFGIWAAAAPRRAHLFKGFDLADSWATDAHKWLNAGYDSGLTFVREQRSLRAAMTLSAAYLPQEYRREPLDYTPDSSRRARGIPIWAVLRSLGKQGVAEMVERNCRQAARFAEGLKAAGYEILNEVVLNQVMVSFGSAETTQKVIADIQTDGTCWCGGTVWQGKAAMRISVSSWATTDDDVEQSLAAIIRIARKISDSNN